jgi:hypothetical protein
MKNFDLNAYGVSEMNVAEMQKTDGGNGVYRIISKFLEFLGVYEVVDAFCEGFTEGVAEGFNAQQNN